MKSERATSTAGAYMIDISELAIKEKRNILRNAPFPYKIVRTDECNEKELDDMLKPYIEAYELTDGHEWNASNTENDYRTIDLFAGIGGIRSAYSSLGCKNVFSSEIDKHAVRTYLVNYDEKCEGNITKIVASDIPEFDILLGGFPCQAFSHAGLRRGFDDTRGTLFFEIARILKERRPKAFMLENVPALRTHDHGRTFETILGVLDDIGYDVPTPQVLNGRDFGVPQNRNRIVIVGFDKSTYQNAADEFTYPQPTADRSSLHASDILETGEEAADAGWSTDEWHDYIERFRLSGKLWAYLKRRKAESEAKGNGFGYTLFTPDSQYMNTISARYGKDGSEILLDDGGKTPRKLTPRECARLQGFGDGFLINASNTQAYHQFGNSVCVPVMQAVAGNVIAYLNQHSR